MPSHFGYCNQCRKLSPARYEERGDAVLLVKNCPDCGPTETIISTDPAVMMGKPRISGTRITVELILRKLGAGRSFAVYAKPTQN